MTTLAGDRMLDPSCSDARKVRAVLSLSRLDGTSGKANSSANFRIACSLRN
jgi:hypothetical protein